MVKVLTWLYQPFNFPPFFAVHLEAKKKKTFPTGKREKMQPVRYCLTIILQTQKKLNE